MKPSKHNILLIEDNEDHAVLIQGILSKFSEVNCICVVRDGEEAIKTMNASITDNCFPDIILLDIKLPKITGLELLKIFKSDNKTRHIPIVVVSTSGMERDRKAALSLGAYHYIVKPCNFNLLYDRLQGIFAELFREVTP